MKPTSLDLRHRIVNAYTRGEGTQAAIALRFCVSKATVQRLLRQHRTTGTLQPKKPTGRPALLSQSERQDVHQWVKENPELTQEELAQRFAAETGRRLSARTMGRARANAGLTRKKSL